MGERAKALPTVYIDNQRVRATEWAFVPGAETGWHRHEHDYVVVPLTDGDLMLEEPGGDTRDARLAAGVPYSRSVGVEHNVINAGGAPLRFLEIEIVEPSATADTKRLALLQRFTDAWNARDVDGLMACMADDCEFLSSAGPEPEGAQYKGREAVRAAYAALFDRFPDAAWTEARHFMSGDRGVSEWRFVGRDLKGNAVDVRGCDIFTFDGDRIRTKDSYRKSRT